MRVSELIEALSDMPEWAHVVVHADPDVYWDPVTAEVRDVTGLDRTLSGDVVIL